MRNATATGHADRVCGGVRASACACRHACARPARKSRVHGLPRCVGVRANRHAHASALQCPILCGVRVHVRVFEDLMRMPKVEKLTTGHSSNAATRPY
eukprot:1415633-Pleurochrysis_carterae.AAC.1